MSIERKGEKRRRIKGIIDVIELQEVKANNPINELHECDSTVVVIA